MTGEGTAYVGTESAPIRKDDAVPVLLNEIHSFENTGSRRPGIHGSWDRRFEGVPGFDRRKG